MIQMITTFKALGGMLSKISAPVSVPLIAQATGLINEQTSVPLTIMGAVGGACWYLSSRLTKIEDSVEQLKSDILGVRSEQRRIKIAKDNDD